MKPLRVLHLVGSAESEFYCDLSRLYAQDCLVNTANPDRYKFYIAYVSPDRQWRFPDSLDLESIAAAQPHSIATAIQMLIDLQIDVVVPQMFCIPGMTRYRALFDLLQIPYVGNVAELKALVADKVKTRSVVAAAGVPIPAGEVLQTGDQPTLKLPIVVKPLNTDNSLGVALVKDIADLETALQTALAYTNKILVEEFIELGREVRCGIVVRNDRLVCLPLEEYALDATIRPIRSYADKLKKNANGDLDFAAKDNAKSWIVDPSDPITERVWAMARKCHIALGCRHYSLFDFRIDPQGEPWFLEAGLYCSFAKTSVLSTMVEATGMSLNNFFQDMLVDARLEVLTKHQKFSR
jgi:D-alanine-D-alanine ligase